MHWLKRTIMAAALVVTTGSMTPDARAIDCHPGHSLRSVTYDLVYYQSCSHGTLPAPAKGKEKPKSAGVLWVGDGPIAPASSDPKQPLA